MYKVEVKRGSAQWYVEMRKETEKNILWAKLISLTASPKRIEKIGKALRLRSMMNLIPDFWEGTENVGGPVLIKLDNTERVLLNKETRDFYVQYAERPFVFEPKPKGRFEKAAEKIMSFGDYLRNRDK